jgi:hypothetical protein
MSLPTYRIQQQDSSALIPVYFLAFDANPQSRGANVCNSSSIEIAFLKLPCWTLPIFPGWDVVGTVWMIGLARFALFGGERHGPGLVEQG